MVADAPLDRLEAASGVDLSALRRVQEKSASVLAGLQAACAAKITLPAGTGIVVVGSLGRGEVTSGSDVDHLIITLEDPSKHRKLRRECKRAREAVDEIVNGQGLRSPADGGAFKDVAWLGELTSTVGTDAETNTLLTHRMLLQLESRPLLGDEVWRRGLDDIRGGYLELGGPIKSHRPPRFLLNDVIRYWRTMGVDFEGKMRGRGGDGWGIRNAKLRTVRKMLFVGGLLPTLECHRLEDHEIDSFLRDRFAMTPVDRVAEASMAVGGAAAGAKALCAYGRFLDLIDDETRRDHLNNLREQDRSSSELWAEVKGIGDEFQQGLLEILFGTGLKDIVREYVVF